MQGSLSPDIKTFRQIAPGVGAVVAAAMPASYSMNVPIRWSGVGNFFHCA
jgi:hypothetical protein